MVGGRHRFTILRTELALMEQKQCRCQISPRRRAVGSMRSFMLVFCGASVLLGNAAEHWSGSWLETMRFEDRSGAISYCCAVFT
jgi:hypothetical protein